MLCGLCVLCVLCVFMCVVFASLSLLCSCFLFSPGKSIYPFSSKIWHEESNSSTVDTLGWRSTILLKIYLGTVDWNAMSGVCLVTQVAKTQFFTRLTASGASSIYAAVELGFWLTCYGQLMASASWWRWNCRGGEKGWENVKTWTRTVTGGVANQRVLVYPVNEARWRQLYHMENCRSRCRFLQVSKPWCDLIDSWLHQINMILPIPLSPNTTSSISTSGKSSLVCASCLHGIFV